MQQRIDFHTHSTMSDGVLLPSEMLRRADALGYCAMAITDHADASNLGFIIESLWRVVREQPNDFGCRLLVGVELTHVGVASHRQTGPSGQAPGRRGCGGPWRDTGRAGGAGNQSRGGRLGGC